MSRSTILFRQIVALSLVAGVALAAQAQQPAPAGLTKIGKVDYKKLETREATERAMLLALRPGRPDWGEFHMMTPFPYGNRGGPKLRDANPPEAELSKMRAGGPGPDLKAGYPGKNGTKVKWKPVGNGVNRTIKLNVYDDNALDEFATGYLYGTVTVQKPTVLDVTMGSDDALRFWLNGKLLVDDDVVRGLDPEETKVRLELHPGVNHMLAKIGQIKGGYEFQMNTELPLDPYLQAQLDYQLNLDFPTSDEAKYYRAITIATPSDVVLEVGGLDVLPPTASGECRPIVCTRRGDVYIVEGAYHEPAFDAKFKKFAQGLHEPLGLAVRLEDESGKPITAVYCTQRGELTRLVDTNGDEVADIYQTFCADWGVSGNYHEFAFGPKFDRDGNAWVTLNVGFCDAVGKSVAKWRGCALKIDKAGHATWVCDGLRSPNGIGHLADGATFYVDNQGDYVGTNRMSLLAPGSWHGHPSSLHWRSDFKPGAPQPPRQPATIWFPYKKMGQSTADILLYGPGTSQVEAVNKSISAAKFGPFEGQIFVGDQTLCTVMRVFLEKVDGVYQGACFPFRADLDSGLNRLCWAGDGSMFIGQTDRGWGSTGRLRYGLQRIAWSGAVPFEVQTMQITADGFELRFTKDLDKTTATNPASYGMTSYTYEYHQTYGSAEMDTARQEITSVDFVDARIVRLHVNKLRRGEMGYVHELSLPGVKDAENKPLMHAVAYYTVQRIPGQQASAEAAP